MTSPTTKTSILGVIVLLTPVSVFAAPSPSNPIGPNISLRSLHEVRALTNATATVGKPADFEATVTYFREFSNSLFVQDGNEGVYVQALTGLHLRPGDVVEVRGHTSLGFNPMVRSNAITLLRHASLPVPAEATYSSMVRGDFDCRYATIRGTVIAANQSLSAGHPYSRLELRVDGGEVDVFVNDSDPARLDSLVGAELQVDGVVGGNFDGKTQLTGIQMRVQHFDQIRIVRPPSQDVWQMPVTSMDRVLQGSDVLDRTKLVRVEGTITYYRPTNMAVLQDGSRSIRVLTPQMDPLEIGDRAEAIGLPVVFDGLLTLRLGHIRSLGKGSPVTPRQVNSADLTSNKYAFDLVSIEGFVESQAREQAQDIYIISSGGTLFTARVPHPAVRGSSVYIQPPPMLEIRQGSKVRVTGVALMDNGSPLNGPEAFKLLLRSTSDIDVIAGPPLLNALNLMRLAGLLFGGLMAIGTWSITLKRTVHRQATAIAKRMKAEAALQKRRGQILEDINSRRPLPEILRQIAELVAFSQEGACCWLQIANDPPVGNCLKELPATHIFTQEIGTRSGAASGRIHLDIGANSLPPPQVSDALLMGAKLARLAIETSGLYSELIHRSEFDMLTEIHNRFSLEKHLETLVEEARERGRQFGLVYIDLNDFKQINDQHGHHFGDLYLQMTAQRLEGQLRPGDVLARLGGDEFAVLVPHVSKRNDIEEIAARLRHCFDEPFSLENHMVQGSASFGMAIYPFDGDTGDSILRAADSAMYKQKRARRERHRRVQLEQ